MSADTRDPTDPAPQADRAVRPVGSEADPRADAAALARELAEHHHLMRQLLRSTRTGYWFIDTEGFTTDVNDALCTLLGRPREQIVGRQVRSFFEGEDLATLDRELAQRRHGVRSRYEIGLRRPDGSQRYCVNNATPLVDTQGRHVGSVGLWTDITERREAEQALRRYELVTNSLTDMVSVIDQDHVYRMVNDAWCRAVGMPREAAVGRCLDAVLPIDEARLTALRECFEQHETRVVRGRIELPALQGRWIETTYSPYAADRPGERWAVLVSRDVTEQERSRSELAAAAEILRGTLDATSDALFASDARSMDEPVRFANEAMFRLWGIPLSERDTLTPAGIMARATPLFMDPAAQARTVREVIESNQPHSSRVPLRDGRVLLRRCIPVRLGEHTMRVWSFRDISAEERALEGAQAREAEQRALLDAFPGFITRVDDHFVFDYVNARVAERLGVQAQELLGRTVFDTVQPELAALLREMGERALAGEAVSYERVHARPGQPTQVDQVHLVQGHNPATGRRALYAFGIDISDRKRAEEALAAARDEADRANRAKSEFLSRMSHELRTPLNAILGFGQILDRSADLSPKYRGWVREIVKAGRHLLDLINDVLDLSRVETGNLSVQLEPVVVLDLMRECMELVRLQAVAQGVQLLDLVGPAQAQVQADPKRLRQVLLNLLSNAIKYNLRGGCVSMECIAVAEGWRIHVDDTGPGLTSDQQQRLFVPFDRIDADRGPVDGTGIGLALSKRLVELMGGQIGVDSAPGAGSSFWVQLPQAPAPAPRIAVRQPAPDAPS